MFNSIGKITLALGVCIFGLFLVYWGASLILDGEFVWGDKFSAEGRDGNTIMLSILVGLAAIAWGLHELFDYLIANRD